MIAHTTRIAALLSLVLATLIAAGCSGRDKWAEGRPPTYFTSGTVLLDGQPVAEATVTFQPKDGAAGRPGSAVTDRDGYFEVQTFEPGDGLTEGTHLVAIRKTRMVDNATGQVVTEVTSDAPLTETHMLAEKYGEFATSGLEVQIKADTKNKLEPFNLSK